MPEGIAVQGGHSRKGAERTQELSKDRIGAGGVRPGHSDIRLTGLPIISDSLGRFDRGFDPSSIEQI